MALILNSSGVEVLFRDDYTAVGSLSALNATLAQDVHGSGQVMMDFRVIAAATLTAVFEGTVDGTNWVGISAIRLDQVQAIASLALAAATTTFQAVIPCGGFVQVRVRLSAYTSGTLALVLRASISAVASAALCQLPQYPTTLHVTNTAAVNTGVTLTLAAPGAGLRQYVTKLRIERLYSVVGVAAAAANNVTTTNLNGSPIFSFSQRAATQGELEVVDTNFTPPLAASAQNTATTFVAPVQLQTIWRLSAWYYVAP